MKPKFESYENISKDRMLRDFLLVAAYNTLVLVSIPINAAIEYRYNLAQTNAGKLYNGALGIMGVFVLLYIASSLTVVSLLGAEGLALLDVTQDILTRQTFVGVIYIVFASKGVYNAFISKEVVEAPEKLKW